MESLWRLFLFDGPRLVGPDGSEQRRFRSQRAAALLAYLALRLGRDVPREELAEALWPEEDPKVTANRLRVALTSLRHQIEPPGVAPGSVLDASRAGYLRLRTENVWCDAVAFEAARKRGDRSEAARLASGELLPGFYDEWILSERERIEALKDDLPLASPELHAEPTVPAAPAPAPGTVRRLPGYLTRYFGREAEKAQVLALLLDPTCRLITLSGMGGQGKTRLAVEVAHAQKERPTWFVALADLWEADRLAEAIRDGLRLPRSPATPALAQVISLLQGESRPLLVLDNLEQIAPLAAPTLQSLLQQVPALTLLVTSRRRLELPGEQEVALAPLPTRPENETDDLGALAALPAVALFLDRARSVRPDFTLTSRNAPDILGLCQLLGGIPLGIELAAARASTLPPAAMHQKLREHWDALPALTSSEKESRHRSLRAAIEWSVALLPLDQRQLFVQLSVFPGGATLPAVESICQSPHALDTLTRLRAASLVQVTLPESGADFRYSLLDVLRQWGAEQLGPTECDALSDRHAAWCLAFALERQVPFVHRSAVATLDELEDEVPGFRAALAHWRAADPARHAELALALVRFWEHRSYLQEGRAALEAVLAALPDGAEQHTRTLVALAVLAVRQGDGTAALTWLESAAAALPVADERLRVRICHMMGRAFIALGRPAEALKRLQESERLYAGLGDSVFQAAVLSSIGTVHQNLRDYGRARAAYEEAIALARASGADGYLSMALDNYASMKHVAGEDGALELYEESLALKRALHMAEGIAVTLSNLATLHCRAERWPEARELTLEVCAAFRRMGSRRFLSIALNRLGLIHLSEGNRAGAAAPLLESFAIRKSLGNIHALALGLLALSQLAQAHQRPRDAARLIGAARERLAAVKDQLTEDEERDNAPHIENVRHTLGASAFDKACQEGASLTDSALEILVGKLSHSS